MISICIPSLGKTSIEFATYLSTIVRNSRIPVNILISKHYKIDEARNQLLLASKGDILFLDEDILPYWYDGNLQPFPNLINYFYQINYPIISGYYYTSKLQPNTYKYTGNDEKPFEPYEINENIEFVDGVGMGICFIKRELIELLENKFGFPLFEYKTNYTKENGKYKVVEISEDLSFCLKLVKLGIKIMVIKNIFGIHLHNFKILPNKQVSISAFR